MEPRPLSNKELQALGLFASGLSTEEIADRLNVQKTAVRDGLRVAVRKLGAVNRVHAVALAVDQRIIRVAGGRARQIHPSEERTAMIDDMQARIRERAYQIWLDEGKPQGSEKEHWARAEAEVCRGV